MKITHEMLNAMLGVRLNGVRVRFTEDYAEAMIAAVAPLIIEECAKTVEVEEDTEGFSPSVAAAAIRALKEQDNGKA